MAHELHLLKGNQLINITPIVGTIGRRSNEKELGEEITFDIAHAEAKHIPNNPCDIGDVVILKNRNKEITRAVIVDENRNGRSPIGYTAFDYAFYLNKSNMRIQFIKMKADKCIKKVLNEFGVPIGNIVSIPVTISEIYPNDKPSDIIREILEMAERKLGLKYLMEMRQGKLYIENRKDLVVKAYYQLYDNGFENDVSKVISNPSRTRSISDMINSIQVVDSEDKLLLTKSDNAMMKKYGKLQRVIELDQEEKLSATQIANNELKELSKITETVSIELLGDDNVRAGRFFDVEESITGIKGRYLITDVDHTIQGRNHTMKLGLGARN